MTYDLIGLPPTPDEMDAFEKDNDPRAYDKVVDRLLGSKHYGERWARHWLDVVKYADTCGYDEDKLRPNSWPYRDYVIRSFNDDKPYAQFVQEQIAGDVLFPGQPDGILGLGFIAAGPWDFIGHAEVPELKIDGKIARNLDRDDMVSNTLNSFCSVTIQCERCHNHKFDPITQANYYALQAVFAAVDRADRIYDRDPEIDQRHDQLELKLQSLQADLQAIAREIANEGGESLQKLNDQVTKLTFANEMIERRNTTDKAIKQIQKELASLPEGKMVYAATTRFPSLMNFKPTEGTARKIHILHRGDIQHPRSPAIPGTIPLSATAACEFGDVLTEGDRRAALAGQLADRQTTSVSVAFHRESCLAISFWSGNRGDCQ